MLKEQEIYTVLTLQYTNIFTTKYYDIFLVFLVTMFIWLGATKLGVTVRWGAFTCYLIYYSKDAVIAEFGSIDDTIKAETHYASKCCDMSPQQVAATNCLV